MTGTLTIIVTGLAAVAGFGAGLLHFRSLRPIAARIVAGERRAFAMQLARLAGLGGFLLISAQGGAYPLLAAFAGILAGRWYVLRVEERRRA